MRFLAEFLELSQAVDLCEDCRMVFVLDSCFLGFVEAEIQIAELRLHGRTLKVAHSIFDLAIWTL